MLFLFNTGMKAQNVRYSDSFVVGQSYCPGSSQYDNWSSFRASLDTTTNQFLKITVKGTFNTTGRECTNKFIVRRIATDLKNGVTGSYSCGGYTWSVGASSACYSGLCGTGANSVELSVDGTLCSCVTPGWSFRPGITNSNWGGINTGTCGGSNQRMTVEFQKITKSNDMGVSSFTPPNICTNTQSIVTKLSNFGTNKVDSFRIYWTVNGNLQTPIYVTSSLRSGTDTTITLNSAFTFTNNTNYAFKFWTSRPNGSVDSVALNDTLYSNLSFLGNPNPPSTSNVNQCGNGAPRLVATPNTPSDSILWYDASTGGKLLGIGRNILGPYITATKTFYAQAMRFGGSSSLGTGFGGTTIITGTIGQYNGAMFNVNVFNSVNVDSFTFKLYQNNPTTNYRFYYKLGTHVGFETNAGAWTLISSGQVRFFTSGGIFYGRVPANSLLLQGGNLYGFYITTDPNTGGGNDMYVTNGAQTASNTDMSIIGSRAVGGLFGSQGVYSTWTANCEFMLKKQCSNPTRTAFTVTVKPRPTGADVAKGTPFNGQYNVGDNTKPDVAEIGKTITYEMIPPTGFSNSGHGSTWVVNNVIARTRYGVTVPTSEYVATPPTGGNPGTIAFTPTSAFLDSFITFSTNYSDLGPHFCDSTIKRTVVVAPTPKPSFKFPASICLGDAVLFDNTTTIHSGNASYTWYFDDGDSSDLQSPVHEYKAPGTYNVKLIAKSFPWNVLEDTTITVEVGELPDVKFRANNKCQGLAVTFQNQTSVANGILTYEWDFGDNTAISTQTNPSHLYSTPGGYRVTLKASANGCVSTLVKNAYMFARPVANFSAPIAPTCARTEVPLPNTSTIALGEQGAFWVFGDGANSTQYDGLHAYTTPGTYNVKLLAVSEFDCKDSITKPVTIKATPSPEFSGNQFCEKIPTIFTNTTFEEVPSPSYEWKFSDNYTSNFKNVTRSWPYEGPFTATLKATYSNGCTDQISKSFSVLRQPKAAFNVMDICSGETADFENVSTGDRGNIQYFWDFGNGTYSNDGAPTRLYNPSTTTTFTVALVASYAGGCSDTARKTITVSESPICDFTFQNLGFLNSKFTPSNTSYSKYEWFFGEGGTSSDMTPNYQYLYSGNFKVTMRATNSAGCECEITKFYSANTSVSDIAAGNGISIYPNPNTGNFNISNADNSPMKVEIFNVLGAKVYSKTTADGTLAVSLEDNAKGIYLVKVTINGFTSTYKITVTE